MIEARALFRSLSAFALAAAGVALAGIRPEVPGVITVRDGALYFDGVLDPSRYDNHSSRFHGHHAITYRGGSMAGKALITTSVPDREIARALAELGYDSGGGIPAAAWGALGDAHATEPDIRASGTRLEVSVREEGQDWLPLGALLQDQGQPADLDLRFVDNRRWIPLYGSGCVVCLASCPGSKIANHNYTIRENDLGPMEFTAKVAERQPRSVELRIRRAKT